MADRTRERLRSMQRVVAVREAMRRREELALAELQREAASLREAERTLDAFLATQTHAGGPLIEHLARSHRGLHARAAALALRQAEQNERVLAQARHEKLAERRVEDLTADVRHADEKRTLAEWTERAAGGRSSLP